MTLLVIDIQKGITDERLYNFEEFISNTKNIIEAARNKGVEIIYVQHDDGLGTGFSIGDEEFEIATEVAPIGGEKIFYKTVNSSFGNKELAAYLEEKEESQLIIVGLQTNFCIDATIKSAFDRGYEVIIPAGCNSTFDNEYMSAEATYQYYNQMMWPERFGKCVTVKEAIDLM